MSNFSRNYRRKDSEFKEASHRATFWDSPGHSEFGGKYTIGFGSIGSTTIRMMTEEEFEKFIKDWEEVE